MRHLFVIRMLELNVCETFVCLLHRKPDKLFSTRTCVYCGPELQECAVTVAQKYNFLIAEIVNTDIAKSSPFYYIGDSGIERTSPYLCCDLCQCSGLSTFVCQR